MKRGPLIDICPGLSQTPSYTLSRNPGRSGKQTPDWLASHGVEVELWQRIHPKSPRMSLVRTGACLASLHRIERSLAGALRMQQVYKAV